MPLYQRIKQFTDLLPKTEEDREKEQDKLLKELMSDIPFQNKRSKNRTMKGRKTKAEERAVKKKARKERQILKHNMN